MKKYYVMDHLEFIKFEADCKISEEQREDWVKDNMKFRWQVHKEGGGGARIGVFKTRKEARQFVKDKNSKTDIE